MESIRSVIFYRKQKLRLLFHNFDMELKILSAYYWEKVKKNKSNKKLKSTWESFKKITPEVQIIILTLWYVHKM